MFIINKCKQPNLRKIGANDLWNRNNMCIYYFTIKKYFHLFSNWYLLGNKFISNRKKKGATTLKYSVYFEILMHIGKNNINLHLLNYRHGKKYIYSYSCILVFLFLLYHFFDWRYRRNKEKKSSMINVQRAFQRDAYIKTTYKYE